MQKQDEFKRPIFTYQARLNLDAAQAAKLDAYATIYGRAQRSLFAAMQKGKSINDLKRAFLPKFGITARQFNALRVGLEGKIESIKARRPELILELQTRIKKAKKVAARLGLCPSQAEKLHQKKRRLHILETKLLRMQEDGKAARVRLCFGSKKLFNAQFDLEANGHADHAAWKADWLDERNSQFFVLGSQDETAGNQSCQASLGVCDSLSLALRLPNALAGESKSLMIDGLRFPYGHNAIAAALATSKRVLSKTKAYKPIMKRIGSALSYRFVRDTKGWRVFVSCEAAAVEIKTSKELGAVGVDINADHLAVSEIDRFGNLVRSTRIGLHTYGKNTEQAKAIIGDAVLKIMKIAAATGKPIVVEKLDFSKKKAELEQTQNRMARMLSSFACNKIISSIKAAAFRTGVQVIEVNPAFTSVIGAVNHAQIKGISVHMGAAFAIARRGLGLSENCPAGAARAPTRNGGHVTFLVPVRNPKKHVWSQWGKVKTALKAAHAAHFRRGDHRKPPPPLDRSRGPSCALRSFTAQFRSANRQQNCSVDVPDNLPL